MSAPSERTSSTASRVGDAGRAPRAALVAPAAVLAAALLTRALTPAWLEEAQLRVFDLFQRLAPRAAADAPVRVVDIDDETLARVGQWPWPRTRVAELIDRLAAAGAGPIAFDILFAEPDRTSPARVLPLWPSTPELDAVRAHAAQLPDHDQRLAESIARAPVVTGFALTHQPTPGSAPESKAGVAFAGDDPLPMVFALEGSVRALPELERAAAGNGHLTVLPEVDGITRRVPLLLRHGDRLYPALAAEALRVAQGASAYAVKSSGASGEPGARTGIVSVKIGRLVVPTDPHGRMWLYARPSDPSRTVAAWRVLDGSLPAGALEGRLVFVGSSAMGLKDIRATALSPSMAGVEVHAQLAEQMLAGQFLHRPDWADGAELVYLLLLGAALIALLPRAGAARCAAIGLAAIAAACGASWAAFTARRWLLDPVMPSVASLGIYLVASFVNFRAAEAQRRRVREAFGRYVSPWLVERLARHPERLRLGGETKTMTVLFADIRGFTGLAERLDAQGLTQFMNRFFTPMTAAVLETQGTVDKYIGDCVMAFWNAPLDDPDHARHAAAAALAMQRRLRDWNRQRAAEAAGQPAPEVRLAIGVNTGACCVGNFGADQRFDYSVIGDAVNVAARLEELTKPLGVDVLVGEATAQALAGWAVLEVDRAVVRGKTQPVGVFALLGDAQMAAAPEFVAHRAAHERLVAAYRRQEWDAAQRALAECAARAVTYNLTALYAAYRRRIASGRTAAPGSAWSGSVSSAC